MARKRQGSIFGTRSPQMAGFQNPLVSGEDAVALGLKSVIPIAELIGNTRRNRALRKKLPTKFTRVDLGAPAVRDMARPSFAPRYRAPAGSSLAEHIGGQKFTDAYQNSQEANFEMQNEMQKRQQEAQNIGIQNQEEMVNAEIANKEAVFNKQIDLMDYQRGLNRRDIALNALNYYLATDPNQLIQSKHQRGLARANYIIQNSELFGGEGSPQYNEALNMISYGNAPVAPAKKENSRSGGKLKTRFSYGKRG